RAGFVRVAQDAFEKDGRLISFQRVFLTAKAHRLGGFALNEINISQTSASQRPKKKKRSEAKPKVMSALEGEALETLKRLRDWRLAEAKKRQVPAFCVLTDKVMRTIAQITPKNESQLLEISGFGPKLYEKHGVQILNILHGSI